MQRKLKKLSIVWLITAVIAVFGLAYAFCVAHKVDELESIAKNENVPVHYVNAETIMNHPALQSMQCNAIGLYDVKRKSIMVDERHRLNPRVLAHELGHYFAIKFWNDNSEEAAEEICWNLIRQGKRYLEVFDL